MVPITISISNPPTAEHWRRFDAYSRLVTLIQVSSFPSYNCKPVFTRKTPIYLHSSLIEMLARSPGHSRLLPNLLALRIHLGAFDNHAILPVASAFLSPLTSFDLVMDITPGLPAGTWKCLKAFLVDVTTCSPSIERFSLKVNPGADTGWLSVIGDDHSHTELVGLVREFVSNQGGSLKYLKVNNTILTAELLEVASKLPHLEVLENSGRRLYFSPKSQRIPSNFLPEGAFPKLRGLYLPANAQHLTSNISNLGPVLRTLTKLTIGCREYASPEVCREIFAAISDSCSALASLEIIACTSINVVGGKRNSTGAWLSERSDALDMARRRRCFSLEPIFSLEYLSKLTIMLDFVLPIDDHALQEALKNRRTPFDILQLSWTPRRLSLDTPHLTFNALNIVAEHCPRIRILSLLLHVGGTFDWAPPSHSFACLQEMNFGLSSMEPRYVARAAKKLHELFRYNVPEISASTHTGHFEKCQFESNQIRTVEYNRLQWVEVVQAFNGMRGVQGSRSLKRFAQSEARIGARYDC